MERTTLNFTLHTVCVSHPIWLVHMQPCIDQKVGRGQGWAGLSRSRAGQSQGGAGQGNGRAVAGQGREEEGVAGQSRAVAGQWQGRAGERRQGKAGHGQEQGGAQGRMRQGRAGAKQEQGRAGQDEAGQGQALLHKSRKERGRTTLQGIANTTMPNPKQSLRLQETAVTQGKLFQPLML